MPVYGCRGLSRLVMQLGGWTCMNAGLTLNRKCNDWFVIPPLSSQTDVYITPSNTWGGQGLLGAKGLSSAACCIVCVRTCVRISVFHPLIQV